MAIRHAKSQLTATKGLTLIEVVVVVAILVVLAGFLVPLARDLIVTSKVNRMLATIDAARDACIRFHQDTDSFGYEDTGDPRTALFSDPTHHTLSLTPATLTPIPGWKGPYLRRPLTIADNPFSGRVAVLSPLSANASGGFDLMGDGNKKTGNGNFILFEDISQEVAEELDKRIDPEISGSSPGTWGRCLFRSTGTTKEVCVYLTEEVL